jgi:hypothetical protein
MFRYEQEKSQKRTRPRERKHIQDDNKLMLVKKNLYSR